MTDTTDIAALKINTYSVNSNDAWPQCADDDRTGSYVKWEDLVKLLSAQRQGNEPETGFDCLKNLKFVADCCIENPDSIYASEFFLLLDEMFGSQGDYSMPVQAVAVSHLIGLLEAERQRADKAQADMQFECDAHIETAESWREWKLRAITAEEALIKEREHSANFEREANLYHEKCETAEAEIAALKGEQAPVALVDERQGSGGFCLTQHGRRLKLPHGTELFTAPQKLTPAFPENGHADNCRKLAWEAVKEAVGHDNWTVGDSLTYFGFYCWGWDMRRQYDEQITAPPKAGRRLLFITGFKGENRRRKGDAQIPAA